jgi:SAM-dependent methyltransferase
MSSDQFQRPAGVQVSNEFNNRVLGALCCPEDQGTVSLLPAGATTIADGAELVCEQCGAKYPIVGGIPRFVPRENYADNFSFEWKRHATTQLDDDRSQDSEKTFTNKTGLTPESVAGKLVLDVGCGMGRFSDVVIRWGGFVVGIDLSLAVEPAQSNLRKTGHFQAFQASVFDLPFRRESFDVIYSLGVLDHTPDCRKGFLSLPPLLKERGEVAIWVYSAHMYRPNSVDEKRDRFYRRFTPRMNSQVLHKILGLFCAIPIPFKPFWHMLLPGFIFHAKPRTSADPRFQWRVLDSFDWYSPVYQSKHTYPEVVRWFREAGLRDINPLDEEVAVAGRK